jgi:protein-lysine N-methyltransferase EEF2KMT
VASQINNILPKIQANLAGVEDAIMLDMDGYVSETNATNLFMVDDGVLITPHADHCLPGITRQTVLELAREADIPTEVRRVSLAEFHSADEVFTTGTMGELTPVTMIDGRVIGTGERGEITKRLQELYRTLPERPGMATELPAYK